MKTKKLTIERENERINIIMTIEEFENLADKIIDALYIDMFEGVTIDIRKKEVKDYDISNR